MPITEKIMARIKSVLSLAGFALPKFLPTNIKSIIDNAMVIPPAIGVATLEKLENISVNLTAFSGPKLRHILASKPSGLFASSKIRKKVATTKNIVKNMANIINIIETKMEMSGARPIKIVTIPKKKV